MSTSAAATGFAPVAYSRRPVTVRERKSHVATMRRTVTTTTGGAGMPKVVLMTDAQEVMLAGGMPRVAALVATTTPPISTDDIPRLTTSDCTRSR